MRWWISVVMLMVVLYCAGKPHALKVISYNIRYDNPADSADNWEFRKHDLSRKVLEEQPAIVGIQEALLHQTTFLRSTWTNYGCYGVGREDGKLRGEMVPVFYDVQLFQCVDSATVWLSESPEIPSKGWDAACERVVACLTLIERDGGDTLFVFNTHWDHAGEIARQQSSLLVLDMLQPLLDRNARIILLGDFNATPESHAISALAAKLKDTCSARKRGKETFNGFGKLTNPGGHIDYIFVTRQSFRIRQYCIAHWLTKDGRWLSDHHAIVVSLGKKH